MYRKSWIIVIVTTVLLAASFSLIGGLVWNIDGMRKPQAAQAAQAASLYAANLPTDYYAKALQSVSKPAQISNVGSASTYAAKREKNTKTIYLTFDDGPSNLTASVLNILDRYKVKATFFVLGQQAQKSPQLIRQIVDGGHALGNHTYDHEYDVLYHNFSDFWGQIKQTEEILRNITGSRPQLIRAPGGTYGHFDKTYFSLLEQAGYKVFDWDVDSGDSARKGVPVADIVKQATDSGNLQQIVLLMHDGHGHDNTVKALPKIIEYYQAKGYSFAVLNADSKPVQFHIGGALPKDRKAPSQAWVDSHIKPNAALFDSNIKPLSVIAGGVQTMLKGGEYELNGGRFLVPLRVTVERLGGTVSWNPNKRLAEVEWGAGKLALSPTEGAEIRNTGNALWVPLRDLLQGLGHPVLKITSSEQVWQVKAS